MSNKLKILLLLLLSLTSVFFAEVIAGSTKYPLFNIWGLVVVIPLYGLHIIILLYIIHKFVGNRTVLFTTLYFAGVLFGLYEGYITKVLFNGLSDESFMFMGVSVIDYIVLVFFWHPIFSFIIPALVFEGFMTNGSNLYEGLPNKIKIILEKKSNRIFIAVIIGVFLSLNASSYIEAFLSGISLLIPLLIMYYILRKKEVHIMYSLSDILPSYQQVKILSIILLAMYIWLGLAIDFKALTFLGQFTLWVSYIVFGLTFGYSIIKNLAINDMSFVKDPLSFKYMIKYGFIIVFTGSFVALFWVFGVRDIFMIIFFVSWIFLGIYILIKNIQFLKGII